MILESRKVVSSESNYLAEILEDYPGFSLCRKYNHETSIYINIKELSELIEFLQEIKTDNEKDPNEPIS